MAPAFAVAVPVTHGNGGVASDAADRRRVRPTPSAARRPRRAVVSRFRSSGDTEREAVDAEEASFGAATAAGATSRFSVDAARVAEDADENLRGFVKTRGSLVPGEEFVFWWTGDIYGLVEDERNQHLFAFEGYNIGRMLPVAGGWRLLTREVGIYRDPVTREILEESEAWVNPYTGERCELMHIWNDPVNQQFLVNANPDGTRRGGGVPSTISGDDLYWHAEISLCYPSPLPASQFPASARTDTYHSLEMFQFFCKTADLADELPSADCQISWVRVGQWLPWMAMADRPGRMVYHCRGKKLKNGYADLSQSVRTFVERSHPEYAHAPENYSTPNETSWTYFKKLLAAKGSPRADGTIAIDDDAPLSNGDISAPVHVPTMAKTSAPVAGDVEEKEKSVLARTERIFSAADLARFNGESVDLPIYLSLGGRVFDVSSAKRHYRRGETYNCLTGRDATCAFVSGDLSEQGLARGTPAAGDELSAKQIEDLEHWVGFFGKSYPEVGRLEP